MFFIKQLTSAGTTTVRLGPFIDDTDGKTAKDALTILYTAVGLSKNGGVLNVKHNNTALTADGALGYYSCVLDDTDLGTLGSLRIHVHVAGALPVWLDLTVLAPQVYESLIGNTEFLEVSALHQVTSSSNGVLTAKKRDGSTTQFTMNESTDASALPLIGLSAP